MVLLLSSLLSRYHIPGILFLVLLLKLYLVEEALKLNNLVFHGTFS
jgi:hypothetical protein